MSDNRIEILVLPSSNSESGSKGLLPRGISSVEMNTDVLRDNLTNFLNSIKDLMNNIPEESGKYQLEEIELTVVVSAEGSIQLVGGIKAGASGGITLRLKR